MRGLADCKEMPWQQVWCGWIMFKCTKACVFWNAVFQTHIATRGRGTCCIATTQCTWFFCFFFMSKRQSTTNNVAAESESVAWAQLESKGPSLVAKGQFQGPEIPIGSLLCLIGWEILINEIYLDFSWWIHSAANLNPSTCYCLESYRLRLVWPPERSASNNFSLGTHQKANDVLKTPEKSHRTMMQFLLKTEHTFWCTNREQLSREFSFFCRVSVREKKEKKNTCFVPLWQVKI